MRLVIKVLGLFLISTVLACVTLIPVKPKTPFSENDFAWSQKKGKYSVSGEAFTMTVGGEPRTCAGQAVSLMPVSAYTDEIIEMRKQNKHTNKYTERDSRLDKYLKKATCNSRGEFKFTDIPAGEYYFEGAITWYAGDLLQVAIFEKKIDVKGDIKDLSIQSNND